LFPGARCTPSSVAFSIDGTLTEARKSAKSFEIKIAFGKPSDPDAHLFDKTRSNKAWRRFEGCPTLMENGNALAVFARPLAKSAQRLPKDRLPRASGENSISC